MDKRHMIVVGPGVIRQRLEDHLLELFPTVSKMYLRETIKAELAEVNGRVENIGYRLRTDDVIEITLDLDRATSMTPDDIELDIIFEDDQIIVLNKPYGMLTHPSHRENRRTLLNGLVHYLNYRVGVNSDTKLIRPGLPHRLDKDTSGLIVAAKTPLAHSRVSDQFMRKRVTKRYMALVDGGPTDAEGTIIAPIGRFDDKKYWGVKEDGKYAESRYWVIERRSEKTLIELEPVTGRTNQLRIHCEAAGFPIVGDVQRGGSPYGRLCLHAAKLEFWHPTNGTKLSFTAPVEFGQTDGVGASVS